MKKKIIALMLVIPILLLFTIYTVTNVVKIAVAIPVSGISIQNATDGGILAVDMAELEDSFYLDVDVQPYQAENKNYLVAITDAAGAASTSVIEVVTDEAGKKVVFKGIGTAKLTVTTADGGYSDSITFVVSSTKPLDFTPVVKGDGGLTAYTITAGTDTDYAVTITSGYASFAAAVYPSTLADSDVSWGSSNTQVLSINAVSGRATAKLSGTAVVSAILKDGVNGDITKTIRVTVAQKDTLSGITVNGEDNTQILVPSSAEGASFLVEKSSLVNGNISLDGSGLNFVDDWNVTPVGDSDSQFLISLTFKEGARPTTLSFDLLVGDTVADTVDITSTEYSFEILASFIATTDDGDICQKLNTSVTYAVVSTPEDNQLTYVWATDDESRLSLTPSTDGYTCKITALTAGTATVSVTAYSDGAPVDAPPVIREYLISQPYTSVVFAENASTWGISNKKAVGNQTIEGDAFVGKLYELDARAYYGTTLYPELGEFIGVTSSNPSVAKIVRSNGKAYLDIIGTGDVTITLRWTLDECFGTEICTTLTMTAVDGVEVSDYNGLRKATEAGKKVVLTENIEVGEELFNYSFDAETGEMTGRTLKNSGEATESILNSEVKQLPTTWDWNFYKNQGLAQPTVNYCIEFKDSLFGNGYTLCADNITQVLDSTDSLPSYAVFRGPLDFVSVKDASSGSLSAAVKGQDNIVFLIRNDDVVIDNAVLKGCEDGSLYRDGEMDLSLLNYTGTTLEIMSNATVKNCRINNGRTVVRAYGRAGIDNTTAVNATAEKINVKIESSILSCAREFILKIASNRFVAGDVNLTNGSVNYTPRNDNLMNDSYFMENFVLTEVTLKNSILATSGLFSVGMESHFAGRMLDPASDDISLSFWDNLKSTGYAALLRLEGDVRIYDWKNLSNVDSSTLIESSGNEGISEFLKLDISSMLTKVQSSGGSYDNIVANTDGVTYAHGGIAFYGGGKNYSMLDASACTSESMKQYSINLNVLATNEPSDSTLYLQGTMLPLAAGYEDFRFFMYDGTSTFNYATQQREIANGTAYGWIPAA